MNKFLAILHDTALEVKDRKVIWVFGFITVIMVIVFGILPGAVSIGGQGIPPLK